MDSRFRVEVIAQTPQPQAAIYAAMHTDYAEGFVYDEREQWPDEERAGELAVDNLLKGGRGHFGPLEHPQITLNCGFFPHSTMQQARTHRHATFDVQSFRYTGKRILGVADRSTPVEDVFYLRPVGEYRDRGGKRYQYTEAVRAEDVEFARIAACHYKRRIEQGFSEEHARGLIPFDIRQHWVVSFSMRALMHFLTIRGKADAQLEIQQLCQLMLPHFQTWSPEIYQWFMANQWQKGRLAP